MPSRDAELQGLSGYIVGKRVSLRPFRLEDVTDTYIGWLNDPAVVKYSNQRFVKHDRNSCLEYLDSFKDTDNLFFSVRELANGSALGTMTAYVSRAHGTADIGILMGERSFWGQGYGQDAWNTLLRWLLCQSFIRKITGGALACNAAMVRIMERSGMRREAVREAQELLDGQPQDIVHFARFRDA